ncbi:MAG: hypothetical protein V4508_22325 [Pseudomonadota bacterium]
MKRYKFELSLAGVLFSLFLAVCYWQAPGHKLDRTEIDGYVRQIDALAAMPAADKAVFLADLRAWGEADDGKPVYMLNLMRYFDRLKPWPGVKIDATTPREANAHYESAVMGMALLGGVQMPVGSNVQGVRGGARPTSNLIGHEPDVDNWNRVLLVRYPCRRAFFELVSNPDYLKVMPYKFSALQLALVPTDGATIMPDPRLLVGAAALIVLLGIGWLRSARRS